MEIGSLIDKKKKKIATLQLIHSQKNTAAAADCDCFQIIYVEERRRDEIVYLNFILIEMTNQ